MRTFVFTDDTSNKFWNIELKDNTYIVTFGRIGTTGQTQTKEFPDAEAARKAYDKIVGEKLRKGYTETTVKQQPRAISPLQRSLEEALAENPDDLAAHSAYADYLMEQDDPRGEFIQVQLALEDPSRPPAERKKLQKREAELLNQHAKQWMGDVGRFLVGDWSGADKPWHWCFARGWLDTVCMLPAPEAAIASLARSPEARLLRRLEIVYDMRYHWEDFDQWMQGPNQALLGSEKETDIMEEESILLHLLESPHLTNLRVFKLGFSDFEDNLIHSTMVGTFNECDAGGIIQLLQKNPRLEELYLNTAIGGIPELFASPALANLRVLQYYFGLGYMDNNQDGSYNLTALADNPALQHLTTLRLHPGRDAEVTLDQLTALVQSPNLPRLTHLQVHLTTYGDVGCRAIIDSGILKRLKVLDIGYGNMTDEGASLLAACPDLKKLDRLVVSRNALSSHGLAALHGVGIHVIADNQHTVGDGQYMYNDVE